jgi:glutathione-independent formaldehyde dehydrogenase
MAAYSAIVKGAAQVMIVDRHPDRLKLAESIGVIPIDDSTDDPVEAVMELTHGLGADRGCECVGWQAHDPQGHEHPNMTLNNLFKSVRATGGLGVVGVFTKDPKSPDKLMKEGEVALDMATFFEKGLRVGTGQCDVKRYNRRLRDLIHDDRAAPSFLVSHELPLDQAPEAYQHFDARDKGWTKVILHPGITSAQKPRARQPASISKPTRRPSRPVGANK